AVAAAAEDRERADQQRRSHARQPCRFGASGESRGGAHLARAGDGRPERGWSPGPRSATLSRMSSYYLSEDLARFAEMGKTNPKLFDLFMKWYGATMEAGALD